MTDHLGTSFPETNKATGSRGDGARLRVDSAACSAHGVCAERLPELVTLDEWGYPVLYDGPVPEGLLRRARQAIRDCPALALRLSSPGPA